MSAVRCMILLFVCGGSCVAQPLTWQDLSGSSGYQTILQSGTGRLFATNHRGVIYQSTDDGQSFGSILAYPSATPILELAVNGDHLLTRIFVSDPNVSARYQVLSWNGVAGDWRRILATSFSFYQALMINDSGFVFGIDPFEARRIVRFDGVSWTPIGTPQSFLTGSLFAGDLNVVTAIDHSNSFVVGSAAGGVYVSTDYGQTWGKSLLSYPVSAINVTLPNSIIIGTNPSPSPPLNTFGGVFQSTDSGRSWRGLGLSNHVISSLAVRSSGTLYALADGGAYRRADSSGEWQLISPAGRQITALALIGSDSIIVSSEAAGIIQSADDGATWTGADIRGKDIFAIGNGSAGELFAGTLGSGVFKSLPNGSGWSQLPAGSTGEYVYSFARSGEGLYAGTDRGVYRTTDDGRSWLNLSTFSGSAYAVAASSDGSLFAGTGFGVYRSADSGATWIQSGLSGSKVFFLSVAGDGQLYAGTALDGVYASSDGGGSWQSRGLVRNDLQTVVADGDGRVFAGVYGGIFRSTDGGSTWQNFGFSDGYVYSILPVGSQTLLAGTYNGIYVSSNGGDAWTAAGDSGLAQHFVLSLAMNAQNHVLAGTYRGSVYRSVREMVSPVVNAVHVPAGVPRLTELSQNYPNPFNPGTEIGFRIADIGAFVDLRIYNPAGQEIALLYHARKSPGIYTVYWDAGDRPSGVYFYQLRVASGSPSSGAVFLEVKKMLLVR